MSDMPTSPVTTDITTVLPSLAAPKTLIEEWRTLASFLKRPQLESNTEPSRAPKLIGRIYLLDMLIMLALIMAALIAMAAGVYIPETALADAEFTLLLVLMVIVLAPVLEEIMFRSWLSGKAAHLLALLALIVGLAGAAALHAFNTIAGIAAFLVGLGLAITALVRWGKRPPMGWFARGFPIFFWLSAVAFALIHIFNFNEGAWWMLILLVTPQFVIGTLAGYVRVRAGLLGAIALHALHNASVLGIAALAMTVE